VKPFPEFMLLIVQPLRANNDACFSFIDRVAIFFHFNYHAGAAPAQIGMKTGAAKLPVFWYTTLERGTLQSTVEGVACNSSAAKAVFKSV
jgi:hypothetical protein